jgi:hypothetical protein
VIASFLVAAVLAGAPAPEAVSGPPPASDRAQRPVGSNPAGLDLRISLKLENTTVVDVLEKLADLLGVTPILEPGVGGRLSLDVRDLPISKALEMVEAAARIDITVSARLLKARTKDRANTAGTVSAPAKPESPPRELGEALRFWLDGAGTPPVTVQVPAYVGRFDLPGCAGPVTVGPIGAYGGRAVSVALSAAGSSGGPATARVLGEAAIDGTKLLLPGCDGRLVVEVGDPSPGATMIAPVRVPKGEALEVAMSLLEVTDESEETLAAPKIQFRADGGFSVKSGFTADASRSFAQVAEIHGVSLGQRGEAEEILLAIHAGVTRTPATADAAPALVARRAESFWLRKGRPLRWTVDSSWNGGRAALVLEVTFLGESVARRK